MEDLVLSSTVEAAPAAATTAQTAASTAPLGKSVSTSTEMLEAILASLSENKAEEVVQIDLRGKTSVCDFMVICSGRSSRQVVSLAEKLEEVLKHEHDVLPRAEGKETGDWVLIDGADVVIHIFRPEVREFYQLEKMWQPVGAPA